MRIKTPITLCILTLFLITYQHVLSNTMKYAFITTYDNIESIEDDDEKAAATWFSLSNSNGDIVTTSAIKNNVVDLSQYKVIWIHIDKENSTGAIPSILNDSDVKTQLTNYYKQGGNLLLTTHATQYIADLGRTLRYPTIIGAGVANFNADVWTVNPNIGLVNNYLSHPIYAGLSTNNTIFGHTTIPLIGSGMKEDHNSMWDLNSYGYSGNVVNDFEVENNARVIGTWGQVTDFCCGGIIEFLPTSEYKGSCLAIGVAAYEWSQNDRVNEYLSNIHLLTTNSLTYLASDKPAPDTTVIEPGLVAHFTMELNESKTSVSEIISNRSFIVENAKDIRENIPGAEGNALRFDGFSTFIKGRFNVAGLSNQAISTSVWCALESYPMMNIDGASDAYAVIAGNISNESGFAFVINAHGRYGFEMFINGTKVRCDAPDKLPRYEWVNLAAVVSVGKGNIQLFKNNELIAKTNITTTLLNTGSSSIYIGKSYEDLWSGPFRLNTINGLIDDFRIYSGEQNFLQNKQIPENPADLSIPKVRFENEIQRPVFHAMPSANWINDPNGLVYHEGEYHLFFQHNPFGSGWGYMSWGHAVSTDLIHWKQLNVVLKPDALGDIFSGCVVIDKNNTAGFGKDAMIAIYTSAGSSQHQSIAFSTDKGRSFIKYRNNPVLSNPGRPDFRDPKVFWYEPAKQWIMSLATGQTISFYQSPDLKAWTKLSEFGSGIGAHGGVWECPDLFPLKFENETKWILLVSINPGAPNGGSGTQYFIGEFNGVNFIADPYSYPFWLDYGKDNYAGITWDNIPEEDGRRIQIAWMNNWEYAGAIPTYSSGGNASRGGMTLPRALSLVKNEQGNFSINNEVVSEINAFGSAWTSLYNGDLSSDEKSFSIPDNPKAYHLQLTTSFSDNQILILSLVNDNNDQSQIKINVPGNQIVFDRRESGKVSFSNHFPGVFSCPFDFETDSITLDVYVDQSSIEIIVNDGVRSITNQVFPQSIYNKLNLSLNTGSGFSSLKYRRFNSIW